MLTSGHIIFARVSRLKFSISAETELAIVNVHIGCSGKFSDPTFQLEVLVTNYYQHGKARLAKNPQLNFESSNGYLSLTDKLTRAQHPPSSLKNERMSSFMRNFVPTATNTASTPLLRH